MDNEKIVENINDRLNNIDDIVGQNLLNSEMRQNILDELKDIKGYLSKMLKEIKR